MPITEVSSVQRLQTPFAACGVVFITWPDGSFSTGSCAVVGRNDILTATHVVYDPDRGGWASDLNFYFGADFNSVTGLFDSYSFSYSLTSDVRWRAIAWPEQVFADDDNLRLRPSESQYDIALIGVAKPIGDVTGWLAGC
jgi:hypothetical protein